MRRYNSGLTAIVDNVSSGCYTPVSGFLNDFHLEIGRLFRVCQAWAEDVGDLLDLDILYGTTKGIRVVRRIVAVPELSRFFVAGEFFWNWLNLLQVYPLSAWRALRASSMMPWAMCAGTSS